ncbi:Hypothetical predicted protein, partial [Paramuricea clavata]
MSQDGQRSNEEDSNANVNPISTSPSSNRNTLSDDLSRQVETILAALRDARNVPSVPIPKVVDEYSSYTYKAPHSQRSVAEIGKLAGTIKSIDDLDDKLELVNELIFDLDTTMAAIMEKRSLLAPYLQP